jgi:hypothetical protein
VSSIEENKSYDEDKFKWTKDSAISKNEYNKYVLPVLLHHFEVFEGNIGGTRSYSHKVKFRKEVEEPVCQRIPRFSHKDHDIQVQKLKNSTNQDA